MCIEARIHTNIHTHHWLRHESRIHSSKPVLLPLLWQKRAMKANVLTHFTETIVSSSWWCCPQFHRTKSLLAYGWFAFYRLYIEIPQRVLMTWEAWLTGIAKHNFYLRKLEAKTTTNTQQQQQLHQPMLWWRYSNLWSLKRSFVAAISTPVLLASILDWH